MRLFIPIPPAHTNLVRPLSARNVMAVAVLAVTFLAPATRPAWGQVTTNDSALQGLQPAAPAAPAKVPASGGPAAAAAPDAAAPARPAGSTPAAGAKPPAHHAPTHSGPAHKPATHPAAKPAAKLPAVPAAPPANPVIVPPPMALPEHKRPPPPPVPIKPDAKGQVSPIANGSRLVFGPGSADLNPAMNDAIQALAARAKADATLGIIITAWAPGTQEDPSTPRRLSLDRALAVRAMLINAGIPSERITAVARGFTGIEAGPPDRLDMTAAPPRATPEGKPAPAAPASASASTPAPAAAPAGAKP